MSENTTEENRENVADKEFWKVADSFITYANQKSEETEQGKVSSSFLYAAARFNAYLVASMSTNIDDFKKQKDEAIKFFTQQYQDMFSENLSDYETNYTKYIEQSKN